MKHEGLIRILVADDHPLVRSGLTLILQQANDVEVVAEAATGRQAITLFRELRPDVTLMDLKMPDMDGVEAIRTIRSEFSDARIILLSNWEGDDFVWRALDAGARGYLLKQTPCEEILESVRLVHKGQRRIPAHIGQKLAERAEYPELTSRELEVLCKLALGLNNAEISHKLFITESTVKFHVTHILSKLGVEDRIQAVLLGLKRGLVSLP